MMRLICSFAIVALSISCSFAQQQSPLRGSDVPDYARQPQTQQRQVPRNQTDPRALQMQQAQQLQAQQQAQLQAQRQQNLAQAGQNPAGQNPAGQNPAAAPNNQPFPPLNANQMARLQQLLNAWQGQSQGTKTLQCKFKKWHFDLLAAPAGVHATKSEGEIRYRSPDNGMYREDNPLFYQGMEQGKPKYAVQPDKAGDYWVCNGKEVIDFDATKKKCTVHELPPEMQGKEIFNSPLPFVFNLDAQKIQDRYWVREIKAPKEGIYLIEAWPKRQADRAQYKMVQIALDQKTFLPHALIMYAPNFNAKLAPMWDHYEFTDLRRNKVLDMLDFMKSFIPQRPPTTWQIVREKMSEGSLAPEQVPQQQAANPTNQPIR